MVSIIVSIIVALGLTTVAFIIGRMPTVANNAVSDEAMRRTARILNDSESQIES